MTGYAHADDEMANEPAPTREMAQEEQNHTSGTLASSIGIEASREGDGDHGIQISSQEGAANIPTPEPGDAPDSKPQTTPDVNALNPTSAGWYRTADGSWYYFTSIADKPQDRLAVRGRCMVLARSDQKRPDGGGFLDR